MDDETNTTSVTDTDSSHCAILTAPACAPDRSNDPPQTLRSTHERQQNVLPCISVYLSYRTLDTFIHHTVYDYHARLDTCRISRHAKTNQINQVNPSTDRSSSPVPHLKYPLVMHWLPSPSCELPSPYARPAGAGTPPPGVADLPSTLPPPLLSFVVPPLIVLVALRVALLLYLLWTLGGGRRKEAERKGVEKYSHARVGLENCASTPTHRSRRSEV